MPWSATEVRLAQRPTGYPDDSTWEIATREVPDPDDGQIVVQVEYISIDPAMRGWLNDVRSYVPPVKIGAVMRAFGAGTVVSSQHPDFTEGDKVTGLFGVRDFALSSGKGVEKVEADAVSLPTHLGALGMPGMTAYFGLFEIGRPEPTDTVLVSAAAGAVGSVVVQLAKARGCRVIGVAGGPEKCAWLRELGCDEVIDHREGNLTKQVRAAAPDGVNVYFDNVGGDMLDAALANLAMGARIVICGAISAYNAEQLPEGPRRYMSLLVFRASMSGFVVTDYEARYPEAVTEIMRMISDGSLQARETVRPGGIAAFPEALLDIYRGTNTGKLVLEV